MSCGSHAASYWPQHLQPGQPTLPPVHACPLRRKSALYALQALFLQQRGPRGRQAKHAGSKRTGATPMKRKDKGDQGDAPRAAPEKMKRKEYEAELEPLHVELVKLQQWVGAQGLKVCIVFEGRDGAGKGGTIKAITERVSPRVFRVVALPAPTEREKSQMYMQRYLPHLPAARRSRDLRPQLVQPRRRRARDGVLHREAGARASCRSTPLVEKAIVDSGIILLKYWLEVSPEEQTRRLEARIDDGRKIWKLSPMDLKSYSRWYDYSRARDEMFAATDTAFAPWYVARTDDKRRARLNIITHLLEQVPYKDVPREKVKLPEAAEARRLHRTGITRSSTSRNITDRRRRSHAHRSGPGHRLARLRAGRAGDGDRRPGQARRPRAFRHPPGPQGHPAHARDARPGRRATRAGRAAGRSPVASRESPPVAVARCARAACRPSIACASRRATTPPARRSTTHRASPGADAQRCRDRPRSRRRCCGNKPCW